MRLEQGRSAPGAPAPPTQEPPVPPSPSEIADAGPFPPVEGILDRALALVEYLREHCPWDRKQTAGSLVPHLLEETHEAVEAIEDNDMEGLRGELGDLLLNLAFQIVVAEESGHFDRDAVVRQLEEKMIRRHPHLFGLGEKEPWEAIKAREKSDRHAAARAEATEDPGTGTSPESAADESRVGILAGLPRGLDPLLRAYRLQEKAAGVGFDWDDPSGAVAKLREELEEVEEALEGGEEERIQDEVGDLLFSAVNVARLAGAHPLGALQRANGKFLARFEALEALAHARGMELTDSTLEELDRLWDEIKEGGTTEGE